LVSSSFTAELKASPIIWGLPTAISGDTDAITNGSLVGAIGLGYMFPNPDTTVNGVTFTGWKLPPGVIASNGNFTLAVVPGGFGFGGGLSGSNAAPYNTLSLFYQALVGNIGGNGDAADQVQLTMRGLQPGDSYQFEWWNSDSRTASFPVIATAGNSVSLINNLTGTIGGLGQYAVGSFTADGSGTEVIAFSGPEGGFLNGFQLRDVTASIPEPASLTLLGTGLLTVGGFYFRRWRRRELSA
jgi:hypothetical protein